MLVVNVLLVLLFLLWVRLCVNRNRLLRFRLRCRNRFCVVLNFLLKVFVMNGMLCRLCCCWLIWNVCVVSCLLFMVGCWILSWLMFGISVVLFVWMVCIGLRFIWCNMCSCNVRIRFVNCRRIWIIRVSFLCRLMIVICWFC